MPEEYWKRFPTLDSVRSFALEAKKFDAYRFSKVMK